MRTGTGTGADATYNLVDDSGGGGGNADEVYSSETYSLASDAQEKVTKQSKLMLEDLGALEHRATDAMAGDAVFTPLRSISPDCCS